MKKNKLTRKQLKYWAKLSCESFNNDPVHKYVTKNEKLRKKFIYHFMIERLATSSREDIIYIDEENRGICIWRDAHNDYDVFDFLMYPNWVFLLLYLPKTIKTLMAYSHINSKVFPENTKLISPVFVDPEHQGKGIATKLIKQGIADLTAKGYKLVQSLHELLLADNSWYFASWCLSGLDSLLLGLMCTLVVEG